MKYIKFILAIILLISGSLRAQDEQSKLSELNLIYKNLEYNTIAFDDLKQKWFINDPDLIRDIFSRFVVKNQLRINGEPVSLDTIQAKAEFIYDADVILDLQRRYYDNEIDFFAFMRSDQVGLENPKYLFDPIEDGFFLRTVIGPTLYAKLKENSYFFSSITKQEFANEAGYYFDIELNALNPRMMYWTTTSQARNKYALALFGQWGQPNIMFPGWSMREYFIGSELTYYKVLGDDPRDYTYRVRLGVGMPTPAGYTSSVPVRPIFKSAQNLYYHISGDFLKPLLDWDDFYLEFEGMIAFGDFKARDYKAASKTQFYSIENFFGTSIFYRNIFNLFDLGMFEAGLRLYTHDIHPLEVDPTTNTLTKLDGNKGFLDRFTHSATLEWGVRKRGGLLQHEVYAKLYFNTKGIGYVGARVKFMLSDTYGFEAEFYNGFGVDAKTKNLWRKDSYLVFSPIIHINY